MFVLLINEKDEEFAAIPWEYILMIKIADNKMIVLLTTGEKIPCQKIIKQKN